MSRSKSGHWHESVRRPLLALAAAAALLSAACVRAAPPPASPSRVLAGARAEGLSLEDPMAISPETVAAAELAIVHATSPHERLRALRDFLYAKSDHPFEYAPHLTLSAQRAFEERRGDCLSFSMLFASLARGIGVPVYFVHVRDVESYYERGGELFVSSHVAVGYLRGPNAIIFDFRREITDWKLSLYRDIDDDAARALFFNNVAVDWMLARRYDDAERLFRVLATRAPDVAEPLSNFGVLLLRTRRQEEALRALSDGIARFPSYKPLYTNAISAADALGRPEVVARLEEAMQKVLRDDPIYVFGRGMRFLSRGAYGPAVKELLRARQAMPESPVVLAGLGRAYVGAGDLVLGAQALEEAKKTASPNLKQQLEDKLSKVRELSGKGPARRSGN